MRRRLVSLVFVACATGAAAISVTAVARAAGDPTLGPIAFAVHRVLKAVIFAAFAVFVITRPPAVKRAREPIAFVACTAAIAAVVGLRGPEDGTAAELVIAGDVVAVLACAWLLAAALTLARCFSVLPEARGLVTHGPYRLVRHPVYLGEFGLCAGFLLAAPTAWNVAMALLFIGGQSVRMRLEERALAQAFPNEHRRYAERTRRLLPLPMARARGPRPARVA